MLQLPPDITFYIEIVLFFLFAWALQRLALDPAQKVIAERTRRTTGAQGEAAALRAEAEEMRDRFERALAEARTAGSSAGDQLRRESEAEERRLLEDARTEAAHLLADVRARLAKEADAARRELRAQADALAELAADKVLGETRLERPARP